MNMYVYIVKNVWKKNENTTKKNKTNFYYQQLDIQAFILVAYWDKVKNMHVIVLLYMFRYKYNVTQVLRCQTMTLYRPIYRILSIDV